MQLSKGVWHNGARHPRMEERQPALLAAGKPGACMRVLPGSAIDDPANLPLGGVDNTPQSGVEGGMEIHGVSNVHHHLTSLEEQQSVCWPPAF